MSFSKKFLSILALCITGLSSPVLAEDDLKGTYATGYLGVSQSTDLDFGIIKALLFLFIVKFEIFIFLSFQFYYTLCPTHFFELNNYIFEYLFLNEKILFLSVFLELFFDSLYYSSF